MKLSIIIVNFNTPELTRDAVRSIQKFGPKCKYEIIVVDNGSRDESIRLLSKLNGITFIQNKVNLGFSKANNIGIKASTGAYTFLLNSDAMVTKGSIDSLLKFAESHADAGVIAPMLLNADLSVQSSIFRLPSIPKAILQYWLGRRGVLDKYSLEDDNPQEVESVVGAAFLMTPKAKKKVGLLSEKYFMYFEDLDYCRSVRNAGLKVYYLPGVAVIHLHGASGNSGVSKLAVESSKHYFGVVPYYIYTFILWSGQKLQKVFRS